MGSLRNPGLMTTRTPSLVLASSSPARRRLLGVLTYRAEGPGLEVVTLNSLAGGRGIGTALLAGVRPSGRSPWWTASASG